MGVTLFYGSGICHRHAGVLCWGRLAWQEQGEHKVRPCVGLFLRLLQFHP